MTGPSYEIGLLQVNAYRALQARAAEVLEKFSLNASQWFMLGQIGNHKRITASALAEILSVDAPLITVMADALIAQGLISRTQHPKDRRAKLLVLTGKGRKSVTEIERLLDGSLRALFDGLSITEILSYQKVLRAIIANNAILDGSETTKPAA